MSYKVIEADSAQKLTELVTTDGQSALGGVVVIPADPMNVTRFYQAVGPAPGTGAEVQDGDTVAVLNSASSDSHDATAVVTGTTLTGVKLAATVAMVDNADVIPVVNSAGADSHNATATITAGVATNVKLAATVAMVDQGDTVTMQNSAGAAIAGSHTATVTAGALANVKLAATIAPVANAQALTGVIPTGTYTNTVTFTVVAGVITAIVLS